MFELLCMLMLFCFDLVTILIYEFEFCIQKSGPPTSKVKYLMYTLIFHSCFLERNKKIYFKCFSNISSNFCNCFYSQKQKVLANGTQSNRHFSLCRNDQVSEGKNNHQKVKCVGLYSKLKHSKLMLCYTKLLIFNRPILIYRNKSSQFLSFRQHKETHI